MHSYEWNYSLEETTTIQTAIVRKACEGDKTAQAWLYNQYSKAMYNVCIRMTGNKNDAADILQDAFVIAFTKLPQLKEAVLFGGWLKRIVINECIRASKKQLQLADWDVEIETSVINEEAHWWSEVDMRIVHQEIKRLPDGCRQVFNLYVLEDFSHKEIALQLGISESTSKTQYHRAKQLLKQRITNQLIANGSF